MAVLAACTGAEPVSTGPAAVPSTQALASLADSLASASSPGERRARIARAFARNGLTPLADLGRPDARHPRFGENGPVLAGFVPGRHPLARPDLVVVGTEADGPHAAPLLEAARVLVERSEWATVPERTVLVALWSGTRGAEAALRLGVWPRDSVRAVIQVGETGATVQDLPAIRIVPGADALDLAQGILDAIIDQARRPARSDTTSAP